MPTARDLRDALIGSADPTAIPGVARFFNGEDPGTQILGVPHPKIFPLAKSHQDMALGDIAQLLGDPFYEVRMAAVSVMDFQARGKRVPDAHRKALYDLYLAHPNGINSWDMVDRAAPSVLGTYLLDKDRSALDVMAQSSSPHLRRAALVATYAFIKRGETADTFRIAALLAGDRDPYVQKAVGAWTREAGKRDPDALVAFLRAQKPRLPKTTMTAATKHLPEDIRKNLRSR